MSAQASSPALPAPRRRIVEPSQQVLLALLALEVTIFAAIGTNFLTRSNAFEVLRLSVEIGLLAVALTPVIVSGGIDLSVGSLMGLAAVAFGLCWRDLGMPIAVAAGVAFVLGGGAGGPDGGVLKRVQGPPFFVTLGACSP